MLSRLFLISTLLLVWITAVAIGAPVTETIESIKSGNHRRLIQGAPGLPQCTEKYPILEESYCLDQKTIEAICVFDKALPNFARTKTTCPDDTTCMDFVSDDNDSESFAVCVDNDMVNRFGNGDKDGVFCKTYTIKGTTDTKVTLSFNIYDATRSSAKVRSLSFTTGNQSSSRSNANNYTRIVDVREGDKIKVCMDTGTTAPLFAMFSYLDGTFS